jgi:hypothetical protein
LPPIGEVEEVKQPTQESEPAQESEPSTEGDDYFQQLQRKGKRLRKKDNESID